MQHPGPHETHGAAEFHEIDAHELRPGQRLLLPDGADSAEILEVDTVLDDYDRPALYFVVLDNHANLRVAHGTRAKVSRGKAPRPADLLFSGPTAEMGSPDREMGSPDTEMGSQDAEIGSAAHDAGRPPSSFDPPAEAAAPLDPAAAPDPTLADPAGIPTRPLLPPRGPSEITLDTGDVVVVPGAAPPRGGGPSPELLARIPAREEKPEDLMRRLDAAHPGRHTVHELAERLARGINVKSGACLANLRELAYELYIGQRDADGALAVADLLAVLPYDGNPGRWASIESALGLAAHLARERGETNRADAYGELLRAPETAETDPFRARMAERVRQRALNEPNLYDKEVSRAVETKDHSEERGWRMLRLGALLHLRAHGGSESLAQDELDRRIEVELDAVRA
ncbi:DUF6707 family protein [Sinomonas mesophila]|uniref:DUF6707 family protein n=1 Tax=Sinomonas mesophila TaxID=1531955 RepID=UPI000984A9BA|nr:DUF6707 family protein [Sinomonas mesophila]